jgi:hypothetical protein
MVSTWRGVGHGLVALESGVFRMVAAHPRSGRSDAFGEGELDTQQRLHRLLQVSADGRWFSPTGRRRPVADADSELLITAAADSWGQSLPVVGWR